MLFALIFGSLFLQIVFSQVYYEPENSAPAAQLSSSSSNTAVSRYTVLYLCGNNGNYYLSNTPCQTSYRSCNYICRTSSWCASFNRNWSCVNNCCKNGRGHTTTPSPQQPTCGGRETSGGFCTSPGYRCPSGFTCTVNGVCCRCAYGTSVGPCVNNQCPDTFRCNSNNECCPYQLTGK
ncbi:unnamed protein product, partial [Mesorhabditis belari]|uniref:Uncharacterized protein n=1 Tax=Mesorhabditis belari TaxID=2138241 RepID=A0AAF3ELP3_9BILA